MSTAATARPTLAAAARLPFEEQIQFFRRKLNLPTQEWDDIQRSAHDRAFIVAGAMKADLLADLRADIDQAIAQGKSIAWFRKEFQAIVAKRGWTGWTGQGSKQGTAWRTRTIYATNLRTSYAAGRWAQLTDPEVMKSRPWWRYVHTSSDNPRLQHKAWHGLVLPAGHAWFLKHYPPNGWGCKCRVEALNDRDLQRLGKTAPDAAPDDGTYEHTTPDGRTVTLPRGVQYGWDYAPGRSAAASWSQLIDDKLLKLDAPIGAMLWAHLKPLLAREHLAAWQAAVDRTAQTMRATGEVLRVTTISPEHVAALRRAGVELENAAVWVRDAELLHALRDTKAERGAAIASEIWRDLPLHLENARAWLDTHDEALIYALELGERWGKVVVRVNYNASGRFDGKRARIKSNFVSTGGWVIPKNLTIGGQYQPLQADGE